MDHVTERMVKVYVARDSIEGHFLKDLLAGHGIEAQVVDENSAYVGLGGIERPKLWVFEKDQDAARQLLMDYEATRKESSSGPDEGDDVAPELDVGDESTEA